MKKTLCLLAFILSVPTFGQDLQSLKPDVAKMLEASVKQDFETIMDLTYPKLFEVAPRGMLIELMEGMFDNEAMRIKLDLSEPNSRYSDIKTIDGRKFCIVRYHNRMEMTLKNRDKETVAAMVDGIKRSGQYETVDFNEENHAIKVGGEAILIAVADNLTDHKWKFINYTEESFGSLFDDRIKKALGL